MAAAAAGPKEPSLIASIFRLVSLVFSDLDTPSSPFRFGKESKSKSTYNGCVWHAKMRRNKIP